MRDAVMRHWSIDLVMRPEYIEAHITHMPTCNSLSARATITDFRPYYDDMPPNPYGYGADDLAYGEAVGTLFSWLRDTVDRVGVDDQFPGQYDFGSTPNQPDIELGRYGPITTEEDAHDHA